MGNKLIPVLTSSLFALLFLLSSCSDISKTSLNASNASQVFSAEQKPADLTGQVPDSAAHKEKETSKQECPYECCINEDGYNEKPCDFDRPCVNNRCVFERCPYECCSGYEKYSRKRCEEGYKCVENNCKPIDDDNDGLLNKQEEQIGTDINNPDTDGDGLTDYEEVKRTKTDPLNPNTDGDRYNDNEDPNPVVPVFPSVSMRLEEGLQKAYDENLQKLHDAYIEICEGKVCSVDDLLPVTGDIELAEISFRIIRQNSGDDYTNYTDYNIYIYTISGNRKEKVYPTIKDRMGFLDVDGKDKKEYKIIVKLSDLQIGGEGLLASVALEKRLILLPEIGRIKTEGEKEG